MKLIHHSKPSRKGFSLFELIIAMVVMVGLAALVAGAAGPAKKMMSRIKAKGQLKLLESGLGSFQSDHGSFPFCENISDGGNVLYKSLFGDYDGDGEPDHLGANASDNQDLKTYIYDLAPPALDENGEPIGTNNLVRELRGDYYVVDPWGNPWYYRCYRKGSADAPLGGGVHNPTYDLWSAGEDDLTGSDEEREAKWIKNW